MECFNFDWTWTSLIIEFSQERHHSYRSWCSTSMWRLSVTTGRWCSGNGFDKLFFLFFFKFPFTLLLSRTNELFYFQNHHSGKRTKQQLWANSVIHRGVEIEKTRGGDQGTADTSRPPSHPHPLQTTPEALRTRKRGWCQRWVIRLGLPGALREGRSLA